MKNIYLFVFPLVFLFSMASYASVSSMLSTPVAEQSYQSLNAQKSAQQATADGEMAKVRAIMAKAKKEVESGDLDKPQPSTDTITPSGLHEMAKELESQMADLNQANKLYQQRTNQKIADLSSKNRALQTKLQKLTQAMLIMNQQLSMIDAQKKVQTQPKKDVSEHSLKLNVAFKYLAFAMTALLAVMLGILIARKNQKL